MAHIRKGRTEVTNVHNNSIFYMELNDDLLAGLESTMGICNSSPKETIPLALSGNDVDGKNRFGKPLLLA